MTTFAAHNILFEGLSIVYGVVTLVIRRLFHEKGLQIRLDAESIHPIQFYSCIVGRA